MKQDKNKIKEPYDPEHTPNPPQDIDPSQRKERGEKEAPVENRQQENRGPAAQPKQKGKPEEEKPDQKKQEKPKLMGESPIEIDDETTI